MILDEREFRDFGKSAYKKANIKKGSALSAFLALVEGGDIPAGSYLLIESLDRLSRADIYTALLLLGSIINKGINVVNITNGQKYTMETLTQLGPMLGVLSETLRAHDESRIKGERSKANWNRRKDNSLKFATPITRECPRWLKVNAEGTGYEVLADRVDSIKAVFEMRKSGLGATAIANRCNERRLPAPAKGEVWHTSLINRLINNRALIGEYQPHYTDEHGQRVPEGEPIKSFYPKVIDIRVFESIQKINQQAREFPKRRSNSNRNILNGLFYCSCGARLHRKLKSAKELDISRYYCSNRVVKLSSCKSITTRYIEDTIMFFMSETAPGLIALDDVSEKFKLEEDFHRGRITENELQIERIANFIQFGSSTELPQTFLDRLTKLERENELSLKIIERMQLETKDSAVYWGIKADQAFVDAVHSGDVEKLSLLRFQIARLIKKITLSEDNKSLHVELKNRKAIDLEIKMDLF